MNLRELTTAIGKALGPTWTIDKINESDSFADHWQWLNCSSGMKLRIDVNRDRLIVEAEKNTLTSPYSGNPPTITVARNRTPESIAADIQKRLLPQYEPAFAASQKHRQETDQQNAKRRAIAERLAKLGRTPDTGIAHNDRDHQSTLITYIERPNGSTQRIDMRVNCDGRVHLKLDNLTPQQIAVIVGCLQ